MVDVELSWVVTIGVGCVVLVGSICEAAGEGRMRRSPWWKQFETTASRDKNANELPAWAADQFGTSAEVAQRWRPWLTYDEGSSAFYGLCAHCKNGTAGSKNHTFFLAKSTLLVSYPLRTHQFPVIETSRKRDLANWRLPETNKAACFEECEKQNTIQTHAYRVGPRDALATTF